MNRWKENFTAFEIETLLGIIGAEVERRDKENDQSIERHVAQLLHTELVVERTRRGYLARKEKKERQSAILSPGEKKAVLAIFPNVGDPPADK